MLSKEAFEQWCWRVGLSDQAIAVITQIRTLPPARHVQSGASNVSGTYPSMCEVLFREEEMLQPSLRDPVPSAIFPSRKRTAIDKESIFHVLQQEASTAENPPSLKEVGQRLGYQPTTLYKINRAACHAIAERFIAYRRELREKRLQGYREKIRRIALYLQAEQGALTQKHISRYHAQPAILRDPKVRELLREVCHELETSDGEK